MNVVLARLDMQTHYEASAVDEGGDGLGQSVPIQNELGEMEHEGAAHKRQRWMSIVTNSVISCSDDRLGYRHIQNAFPRVQGVPTLSLPPVNAR
jgi:hypothetical protein